MTNHAGALDQIALITNHFGEYEIFGDVLQDWFRFLGGKPAQVVVVDGGSNAAALQTARALQERKLIDTLDIAPADHHDETLRRETAYIQEYRAGILATRPYILFFHADTLPYRQGHAEWLTQSIALLQRPDVFAVSGSLNLWCKQHEAWDGWYWSSKCSLNFALMKRELFLAATDEYAGDFIRSNFRGTNPAAATGQARYIIEIAFEKYMAHHNCLTLVQHENAAWTIFHTNARGARLKRVRADFFARKNIDKYIDAGANPKLIEPRDAVYYGQPRPSLFKRARIYFGQTRWGPHWRTFKHKAGLRF